MIGVVGSELRRRFQDQALEWERGLVHEFQGLIQDRVDLLEVCCPWDFPLSKAVEEAGGRAFRMGLHNGYDMSTKEGLRKALTKLRELKPRYLHVSPPCYPFSSVNNANQKTPAQRSNHKAKQEHGRLILKNCLKLIQVQRQELDGQSGMGPDCQEAHAGDEQPLRATSWKEPAVRNMLKLCGERFSCDGCRFGLENDHGDPIRKPWGWFSSLPGVKEVLHKVCQKHHPSHAPVTGKDLAKTAIYPEQLCRDFAKVLIQHRDDCLQEPIHNAVVDAVYVQHDLEEEGTPFDMEPPEQARDTSHNHEDLSPPQEVSDNQAEGEPQPEEQEPGTWDPQTIEKKLRTIHANLGHPSNQVLVRMLKDAKASPGIIQKAQQFQCPQCAQRGHAQPHRTSQVPHASRKWESVSVDTFWWHSPHKDPKGNPQEHTVGISWLDEASDFHTAVIVRSGDKKQGNIKSAEFRDAFSKHWLRTLPKPESLRFDDEGSFRDTGLIDWIEAQAIKIGVIAGEAAWQVGKHSRHLEVLKENMTLLSLEVGPEVKAEELLGLSLAAKNELHNIQGYSPNQWCFGQGMDRIASFLQHGNHLPTQSLRGKETFEETLQRAEAARRTFLQADCRRRILRAARGKARKNVLFEPGQLVYFYRKGRNNTSRHEAGWHGPARVVAIEKQGQGDRNQTVGSVVWIVHATILYRCAPEQLRLVPESIKQTYEACRARTSPLQDVVHAGNQANYRDISQDLAGEAEDAEIHDVEPPEQGSSRESLSFPPRRLVGKQPPQHEQERQGSDAVAPGEGQSSRPGQLQQVSPSREGTLPQP